MGRYKFSSETVLSTEGGMGITWKGFDDHLKRDVVIKTIKKERLDEQKLSLEELNNQLIDEAKNQAKITHQNIAKVYDYYKNESDGLVYLVFEYIDGLGLNKYPELIQCNTNNLNEVLDIFEQIINGIICAHKNNIIHRDIKLDNILYNKESKHIKIIDFGISKIKEADVRAYTLNMYGNTPYFAPERFPAGFLPKPLDNLHIDIEEKFDIYALGVLFFTMLTGEFPYRKLEDYSLATPRVADFRDDINEELDEAICGMIQVNPKARVSNLSFILDIIKNHKKIQFIKMSSIPTFNARNKVRDPLHGYIELTDDEMLIINHKVFQRLRNIKQLGTTYLVYPGATHGRFTHSLGVLYLSTKIFDIIMGKNSSIITWDYNEIKKQRQMLRIASLLHDIGHSPFSHVGDNLFSPVIKNHEEMSANLIINTDLSEIIDMIGRKNGGFTYREIAGLIKGRIPSNYLLIKRVFSGDIIDADRMDYLLRDSLMLGVKYGKYDLDHLINSLNIIIDNNIPILSIEEKGIYALEEFILARHFMFTQVYLHKTRRIYDKILERSMQCMLPSNHLPIREEEFLQWDDNRVLEYIKNNPNSYNDMFLNRGHLKLVFERFPYIKEEEKLIISEIEELINNRRYLDTEVIVDRYTQNAIKFEDEMGNPSIGILDKNKNIHHVDKYSSILSKINDSLDVFRIYANEEKRDEIIKVIEEAYSKCLRP